MDSTNKGKEDQPYCLMPWIHLHVGNGGNAQACCVANIPFGNINHQSVDEIWNGEPIQNLRSHFLKGKADNRCYQCIQREKSGAKSIRQETWEKYGELPLDYNKEILSEQPVYFDIRFSNVCNFSCRTCWHGASSSWFQDAKKLKTNLGDHALINNITDFDQFISDWGPALLNAKEIYFAGGEPLVTEQHYQLLDYLITNKSTNLLLRYNTNFSILKFQKYDLFKLWKEFDQIEILASIDASNDLGEFIRKGMKWKDIIENRAQLSLAEDINYQFKIAPTISVFNILELPNLYKAAIQQELILPNDWYMNILERPNYFNIQILPKSYKNKVDLAFKEFFFWLQQNAPEATQIQSQFEECLGYMWAKDDSHLIDLFKTKSKQLDQIRGEHWENFLNI